MAERCKRKGFSMIILSMTFFVLFIQSATSMIGVSPYYYNVDFQPNWRQVFHFEFFTDGEYPLEVYSAGDLSQYVELSKSRIESGSGGVNVLLHLPEEIEIPGTHSITIGARQVPDSVDGFGIVGDIRASINVHVPYPGKYAITHLKAENAKAGEPVEFEVQINNLGKESIVTNSYITVYNSLNESVAVLNLDNQEIGTGQSKKLTTSMDTSVEQAGLYSARVVVEYGGRNPAAESATFRLGELYFEILGTSNNFKRNDINRFDLEVESFWNDAVDNVYAEISIPVHNIRFKTPSLDFSGFDKKNLSSYFDTSGIPEDVNEFKAKIIVYYQGKTSEKIVTLRFIKETDYLLYVLIAVVALALILLVASIIFMRRIRKSNTGEKNETKKTKGK